MHKVRANMSPEIRSELEGLMERALRQFEPMFDRVIVHPVTVRFRREKRRIVTPDISQDHPETGVVVAVPSDCVWQPGDVVLFGRFSGYGMAEDTFLTLRETDIWIRLHEVEIVPSGVEPVRPGESPQVVG